MAQGNSRFRVWASLSDLAVIAISFWIALLIRFEFSIPAGDMALFRQGLLIAMVTKILVFYGRRIHLEGWWRYFGFVDTVRLLEANLLASILFTAVTVVVTSNTFPRSIYILDMILCFLITVGARSAARLHRESFAKWPVNGSKALLIYGAGVAGIALAREVRANPALGYWVVGFLDDDPRKKGMFLMGLEVLGSGDDAPRIVASNAKSWPSCEIVVTMPSATGRQIRAAVDRGRAAGVTCRFVPGLGDLIRGKQTSGNGRELCVTELLDREPANLDLESVRRVITGRSILVTGAAGSIGSELCRQIAEFEPGCLVALDKAETELFYLEDFLRARFPLLNLQPEIGDIRDAQRVAEILERHAVTSVYHAAAYKHVPMMERELYEAVRNNVLGTWNLVQASRRHGVTSFVLISSDKAVNPSSVMGLTKRIAELIVSAPQPVVQGQKPRFVCLRFGNVLVSNGSVVPTFQQQIAAGGPVTVTHPEVRRYFMTVQEAVQLVLTASTIGTGSEIFVLDMGKPVRILDLARKMITLAGFVPDEDIEIHFTGLRKGEKLFEELTLKDERILPTRHEKIAVFKSTQVKLEVLAPWIAEVSHLVWRRDGQAVIDHLKMLVPEYQPSEAIPATSAVRVDAQPRAKAAAAAFVEVFNEAAS